MLVTVIPPFQDEDHLDLVRVQLELVTVETVSF